MIELTNRQVNRWMQLLEFDIKKLKEGLADFDDSPIAQTQAYTAGGKYDLMPVAKENMQRQLRESEDSLKNLMEEVDKKVFEFGLGSRNDTPKQKVLSIK